MDTPVATSETKSGNNGIRRGLLCSKSFTLDEKASSFHRTISDESISSSSSSDEANYVIKSNVCHILSRELNIPAMHCCDDQCLHKPPANYGLCNADAIIPSYYHLHKNPQKIQSFDFYMVIKDDIRNFRPLNKYQFEYIKSTLSSEDKDELLRIFNESLISLCEDFKV